MLTIEKLRAYGANVDEGMGRCMNNEAFYLRLVNMAADDGGFEKLRAAMESGDRKESFEAAHALKGMLGNLSLTPVCRPASELTELLRSETGNAEDGGPLLEEILAQREKLLKLRDEA